MPVRGAHVAHAHVHAMHLRSWCHLAPSTSPTSPAPQPRANAHMLRHGKLRPWHPLPHRFHMHRPFLVAAGRTKPGSTRKVPCRHGRCREARALEIRVHGSIHGKLKPVTASVPCAGRALRPRIPPWTAVGVGGVQLELESFIQTPPSSERQHLFCRSGRLLS